MRVFIYGDNVDTEAILPARYRAESDPKQWAAHCFADLDDNFARSVHEGDVIVAGLAFGCGSAPGSALIALRDSGVACVIARSFSRIFHRDALRLGFPLLSCPEAVDAIRPGDTLSVRPEEGVIRNETTGQVFAATPMPSAVADMLAFHDERKKDETKALVVKKSGGVEPFDEMKIYYSLAAASDEINMPLPHANLMLLSSDVGRRAHDGITTAQLRELIATILKEQGYGAIAEAYARR